MSSLPADLALSLAPRYEVQRELGRGGMATVFLARDTRHDRSVAVKVLLPELAASVGAERFLAEIRLTAQLQHPNILPLFDSGDADGLLFYVMPYVAGETLRAKLDRERQLPVTESIRIATGIAAALEHAHRAGVVHRDLKPENILLHDGDPLVADFGIALAIRRAAGERLTLTGMSPEQAAGERILDARSDLFALGCVLYEMLAGETPFAAPTAQATIARILAERPRELTSLRAAVPAHVSAAISRSLEKLPADRWNSAQEFSQALGEVSGAHFAASPPSSWSGVREIPWLVAGVSLLTALAAVAWSTRPTAATLPAAVLRIPIVGEDSVRVLAQQVAGIPFAVSNDERRIVYVGPSPTGLRLYVRFLDELHPRAVAGTSTEGSILNPVFSPDGESIALQLDRRYVRIPVGGGKRRLLVPVQAILESTRASASRGRGALISDNRFVELAQSERESKCGAGSVDG